MPTSVWRRLASTWPVSTALASDRHRAEPVDDASGHVHRDHDCGALDGGSDGHQQDAGCDVVEVPVTAGVASGELAAETVAELPAEDVDEEQQEHDRHADEERASSTGSARRRRRLRRSIVAESVTV